jgi:hypothetical protein
VTLPVLYIAAAPTVVTEHRVLGYWCPHCRKHHSAALPKAVEAAGLFRPRLTALVAYWKGVGHASFSTIRKFLRDMLGVQVSRGYLAKLIAKVSRSLAAAQSGHRAYERGRSMAFHPCHCAHADPSYGVWEFAAVGPRGGGYCVGVYLRGGIISVGPKGYHRGMGTPVCREP